MQIVSMRVNQMENPIGFSLRDPAFSWIVQSEGRKQTAFHVQIRPQYSSKLFFDSGKVFSDLSHRVRFGICPEPGVRYYWRVRVWDDQGGDSDWSQEASFETGRGKAPWKAGWIGPDQEPEAHPLLRRVFEISGTVKIARLYVCGLGLYEMYLNGSRIGEEYFTPGYNAYDLWQQVQTYDVTELFHSGKNVLGAMLGNGWYKGRFALDGDPDGPGIYGNQFALLCELSIEYLDGTRQKVCSDGLWRWTEGPVLDSSIYDGERYDARREKPDWMLDSCDDSSWRPVASLDLGVSLLEDRRSLPVKITQELPVQRILTTPAGETVLDFGQNLVGWVRFRVRESAGTELLLEHGEVLDPQGNFYRENMRSAKTRVHYFCREGEQQYAPRFSFFGFRYVRLTGFTDPRPEDFTAQVIHSEMERIGRFHCSEPAVDRLYENTVWGQRGNFLDVPTDCPQRDERLGWTGDAQIFAPTASLHYDTDAFYHKYLYDLAREQEKNGWVPMYVPFCRNIPRDVAPCAAWGDAATIIPWTMYVYYGDLSILEEQYDSMKAWVDYEAAQAGPSRIYGGLQLGDWLAQDTNDPDNFYGATPLELVATCYFAHSARILSKTARLLGKSQEAKAYHRLFQEICDALYREFITPSGRIVSGTQTAEALLLNMRLLKKEHQAAAVERLTLKLEENGYRLTTGFVGTPCLCPALAENGALPYAYHLLLEEGYPSWLYEVNRGATTVWERWNSIRPDGSLGAVNMNSFNHYAYGAIAQFLYETVAGIRPDEREPGFHRAWLIPRPHCRLRYAGADLQTPYGELSCSWELRDRELTVRCRVPFNSQARLILPDSEGVELVGGGDARRLDAPGDARFDLPAGAYQFRYRPNGKTIFQEVEQKLVRLI